MTKKKTKKVSDVKRVLARIFSLPFPPFSFFSSLSLCGAVCREVIEVLRRKL